MFNLKRKIKNAVAQLKPQPDPQTVIAEIHESFDSASERLLNDAKRILNGEYDIEKGERLKKIGFGKVKKAVEATEIVAEKEKNKKLADLIDYYRIHYPNNKFITEEMTKAICHKYGLVCGEVSNYIGDVPEKNISEIESFNLRQEDMVKNICGWYKPEYNGFSVYYSRTLPNDGYYGYVTSVASQRGQSLVSVSDKSTEYVYTKNEFQICAPVKDFDTKNMRIEDGYKLSVNIPDPVVLQPVNGGYLVVSKWGLEANDEIVVNQAMN